MKEYIERASLMGALTSGTEQLAMREMTGAEAYAEFVRLVNFVPAADVVEVVRCGECRHAEDSLVLWCTEHEQAVSRLDFCSHGARMDKEADHD